MKARIKKTGRIVDLSDFEYDVYDNEYLRTELEIIDDYWDKLKHQAAISAMQGLLSNSAYLENFIKYYREDDHLARVVSRNAIDYATILIDKLKEESK